MPDPQPTAQPDQQTPPVPVLSAGTLGTPAPSLTPASGQPNPNAPAAPTGNSVPASSVLGSIGHGLKHIAASLEGKQINYVPDPNKPGMVQEVVAPRGPGGFFRDLLLGAMIGGAAGASAPKGSGALGGFASGGVAAYNAQQQGQENRRVQAQDQADRAKNLTQEQKAEQDKQTLAHGAIAQNFIHSLDLGHNIGQNDDTDLEKHHASVQVLKESATSNGGELAQVDGNGEKGNGPDLMKQYMSDPGSVMQAPQGFFRIPLIDHDTDGLEHKNGQWIDPATGQPPDWNSRATVTLIDLPTAAWDKTIALPNSSINDAAGYQIAKGNPTSTSSLTYGSLFGLGLKNLDQINSDRRELQRAPKNENEAKGVAARVDDIRQRLKDDPDNVSDEDKRYEEVKGPMIDKYNFKETAPTTQQVKNQTEAWNTQLAQYAAGKGPNLKPDDRATLVQRQKQEAIKGVPSDIIAAIGSKPVPAQFDKGEDDPAYKAAAKLWGDASLNKKTALTAASGLARYQMMGDIRDFNVTNATDQPFDLGNGNVLQPNESGRMTANQLKTAPPGIILNTGDGLKVMAKGAAIRDIQSNVDNLRDKFSAIDELNTETRAKLVAALRDPNPDSAIHDFSVSEAKALALDPKLQDLTIAMQQMAENVMLTRPIQGIGGAGSDMMRRALANLVPNATTPSKEYAGKQLDAFQRTLNQLKTGVPTVGGKTLEPVSGARTGGGPAKPATPAAPAPQTHVFSLGAWQTANPTGDANAAKAAAQKSGYTVTQ